MTGKKQTNSFFTAMITTALLLGISVPASAGSSWKPGIYVMDADGTDRTRIVSSKSGQKIAEAAWSSDGAKIAYRVDSSNKVKLLESIHTAYTANADGGNRKRVLRTKKLYIDQLAWSPDGSQLAFIDFIQFGNNHLYTVATSGGAAEKKPLRNVAEFAWSPDGSRIAYISCSSRRKCKLYISDIDGANKKSLGSTVAQDGLVWSSDGSKLGLVKDNFFSDKPRPSAIYTVNSDGSDYRRALTLPKFTAGNLTFATISPDLTKVVIGLIDTDYIYTMNIDGSGLRKILNKEIPKNIIKQMAWSPDGSRLLFTVT